MDVSHRNFVTASGDSDPQMPAVGSEQVGSRGSSSIDHRTTGVDSQAPVSLNATSADADGHQVPGDMKNSVSKKGTSQSQSRGGDDPLESALNHLKMQLVMQQGGLKVLLQKSEVLQVMSSNSKSPQVQVALNDVFEAVEVNKKAQEKVAKAFKLAIQQFNEQKNQRTVLSQEIAAGASNSNSAPTKDLAEEISSLKSEVGELSKMVGQLASMKATETSEWTEVVKRKRNPANPNSSSSAQPAKPLKAASSGRPRVKLPSKKPPAVLIKPSEGKTFAETVRTLRSSGLSAQELGASVAMRQTRDGCLLLELAGGVRTDAAAKKIASTISARLGDSVGKVVQLGAQVEVEVLDLDAASSAAEVLEALRAAIPGDEPTAAAEREAIGDVRIWSVRAGQQVATAKVSRYAASLISKIPVGWTMCRVRPRSPPPERCYRCQAFGHTARSCSGTDRSGACWRCGDLDHRLATCKAERDRCLACEMAGLPKVTHKPGSRVCAARRLVAGGNPTTNG